MCTLGRGTGCDASTSSPVPHGPLMTALIVQNIWTLGCTRKSRCSPLLPQPLKPRRVGRRVHDGVLNVPMSHIVLNKPHVCALIGESEAASVAQHMRMSLNRETCALAIRADRNPCRLAAERAAPFTDKKSVGLRLHCSTLGQPYLDHPAFVTPERVRSGQALFEPRDMQHSAFCVHLRQLKPAGLRHAQAMPEHQEQ